jgi:hypothetical protein
MVTTVATTSAYAARCGRVACGGLRGHADVVAGSSGLVRGVSVDGMPGPKVDARFPTLQFEVGGMSNSDLVDVVAQCGGDSPQAFFLPPPLFRHHRVFVMPRSIALAGRTGPEDAVQNSVLVVTLGDRDDTSGSSVFFA